MTDQSLYENFLNFGRQALAARNKCIGLLPEIHRRQIHQQKGYHSIYEFAAKLAGLSHKQVNRALNLDRRFSDKPALHQAFTSGEISLNKLVKVVSIATIENQHELVDLAKKLSARALETLVRDEKSVQAKSAQDVHVNTRFTSIGATSQVAAEAGHLHLPAAGDAEQMVHNEHPDLLVSTANISTSPTLLNLDHEVSAELLELQRKGFDLNQLLKEFLQARRDKIAAEKAELSTEQTHKAKLRQEFVDRVIGPLPKSNRYIPIRIRKILTAEHGTKCSIHTCRKPSQHLHHTQRFALANSHDPHYIAPLCREHHQIAHAIDEKVLEHR